MAVPLFQILNYLPRNTVSAMLTDDHILLSVDVVRWPLDGDVSCGTVVMLRQTRSPVIITHKKFSRCRETARRSVSSFASAVKRIDNLFGVRKGGNSRNDLQRTVRSSTLEPSGKGDPCQRTTAWLTPPLSTLLFRTWRHPNITSEI